MHANVVSADNVIRCDLNDFFSFNKIIYTTIKMFIALTKELLKRFNFHFLFLQIAVFNKHAINHFAIAILNRIVRFFDTII